MELLLPLLILLLLVPMFLSVRRQKKEMDRQAALQDSLSVGDRIMTTSGLYATILAVEDTTVEREIAPGVVATWMRLAIRDVVREDTEEEGGEFRDHDNGGAEAHGRDSGVQ
ncbi:preprotein translocase subunit YajC [Hoyosella sp. G463]|uniref:Preprotein translocase subunit YajC n=1 Tax=Lolliginicoccus lacisalsi TaxID=2742202 RepID=A0A927JAY2_9ACTN|nr:preprotein translocase subunit YajC [Lolliginicoccus lacisalsi]MBD8505322.1 preprotein translocase subunit YajC [Lolliginicoccus lacisalsi]